ncbi:MAG: hypothetical protein HGA61_03060 [Candidatus Moranbacteria bacterium]|nr:hypothetical protein [Candidatus Moranbacteria bacterium]
MLQSITIVNECILELLSKNQVCYFLSENNVFLSFYRRIFLSSAYRKMTVIDLLSNDQFLAIAYRNVLAGTSVEILDITQ